MCADASRSDNSGVELEQTELGQFQTLADKSVTPAMLIAGQNPAAAAACLQSPNQSGTRTGGDFLTLQSALIFPRYK
jgi:hypothetical protein